MRCDVVVVGASIAGTVTAIELVSHGVTVVLIDKSRFPRRKACGEGISVRGIAELEAAGLSATAAGVTLDGYRVHIGGRVTSIEHKAAIRGVRREQLDAALVAEAATRPGLTLRTGESLRKLEISATGASVETEGGKIDCRFVVAADGGNSHTLTMAGAPRVAPHSPRYGLSGAWGIVRGTPATCVETFLLDGGEVFFTPVGDGLMNVSFLGSSALVSSVARGRRRSDVVLRCARDLGLELEAASETLGASAVNAGCRMAAWGRVLAVGDACECFDPVGGMGMTHAVMSARLAAKNLLAAFDGGDAAAHLARYAKERDAQSRTLRGFTRVTGLTLGTALGRRLLPLMARTGVVGSVSRIVHEETGGVMSRLLGFCGVASIGPSTA